MSREKAYRFARTFESAGFLTSRGAVVLVRLEELIDAWLTEDKLHPAERVPVRSLFGRWRRPPGTLLGGFGACKAHDVLHRSEAGLEELHIRGAVDQVLEEGDLERTEPHAAQAVLVLSRHPESVFRAVPFAGARIERRARPDERDKDCAYWYDVARTTHSMWPEMSARVQELRAEYPAGWFRTAADALDRWFLRPRAEGPTLAARVIRDQLGTDTRPDAVNRVVRRAVEALGLGRG